MADALEQAVQRWAEVGVVLDRRAFEQWLGPRRSAPQLAALALVYACLQKHEIAVAELEREHLAKVRSSLRKMNVDAGLEDELMSWLRFELFARAQGPLLSTYTGKGDLTGFLRAIAAHEALKRLKRQRKDVSFDALAEVPMPGAELASMKGAYGKQFTFALDEAFRALEVEERNLLRQYFLDGLSIDALARLYSIHRATAARRVNAARDKLTDRVRATLVTTLQIAESSVDEVITLSNLEESLGKILERSK